MTGLDADRHARAGTLVSATLALEVPLLALAEIAIDTCHVLHMTAVIRPARAAKARR